MLQTTCGEGRAHPHVALELPSPGTRPSFHLFSFRSRQHRGLLSAPSSHLAKYRSLLPSLALLFHLIDGVDTGRRGPVSRAAAAQAAAWCEYLAAHARRLYAAVTDAARGAAALTFPMLPNAIIAYISRELGHSSIQVTVDLYGHFIPGADRHHVEALASCAPYTGNILCLTSEGPRSHKDGSSRRMSAWMSLHSAASLSA